MTANHTATPAASGNRNFLAVLLIVLVLGVAAIGYVVFRPKPGATVATVPAVTPAPVASAAAVPAQVPGQVPAQVPAQAQAQAPAPKGYVRGSDKAPVEVVMYGDFECPGCGMWARGTEHDVEARLVKTGAIRFRFMDYPLPSIHRATLSAHNAAACAGAQRKFWEMHDRIYNLQDEWSWFANGRDMNAPAIMKRYAKEIGLDTKVFDTCLDTRQFEPQIRANYEEGVRVGVGATPTFVIGIRMIAGGQPYDVIKKLVDSAAADAKKLSATSSTPK